MLFSLVCPSLGVLGQGAYSLAKIVVGYGVYAHGFSIVPYVTLRDDDFSDKVFDRAAEED